MYYKKSGLLFFLQIYQSLLWDENREHKIAQESFNLDVRLKLIALHRISIPEATVRARGATLKVLQRSPRIK